MLDNEAMRDVSTMLHPSTNVLSHETDGPSLKLSHAKGVRVYDTTGKDYIEGVSGLWCTSLGYGNEELVEVAAKQMRELSFAHIFNGRTHDPAIQLAETIKEVAPCDVSKVFFTSSGSEANDTQVKLVWCLNNMLGRPKKKKIISRRNGYHGVTIATASMTGLTFNHNGFDLPQPGFLHTTHPHFYRAGEDGETEEAFSARCAADLEDLILKEGPETIAAFIAEPVMGAGGAILSPKGYFEAVEPILRKYDIYFIADEVVCGFGRTGEMFGSQTFNMSPDSISLAKAITSAYFPTGAVTVPEAMYEALQEHSRRFPAFGHGFTYSGHPVGMAVANKVLEIYKRDNIVEQVRARAVGFQKHLMAIADHPLVGNAQGVGLIGGIELVQSKKTKALFDPQLTVAPRVARIAQDRGLIVRAIGAERIGIAPPLVSTDQDISDLFDRLTAALDSVADALTAEGLRFG